MSTVQTPPLQAARSTRGRRGTRVSSDEREHAIMQTAERLLEERSLGEISVDDLANGAGISRPAFYFYFPSKDAVILTLVDRVVAEATLAKDEALGRRLVDPTEIWRRAIEAFYRMLGAHRAVIRAVVELSATNAEARALRSQMMEVWITRVSERIEAERARGAAARDIAARELATALVQMNERVMQAVFADEAPALEDDRVVDVLCEIWLNAIYGSRRGTAEAPSGPR